LAAMLKFFTLLLNISALLLGITAPGKILPYFFAFGFIELKKCLFEHKIIHYLLSVYIELSITTECLVSYAQNGLFEMIFSSRFL